MPTANLSNIHVLIDEYVFRLSQDKTQHLIRTRLHVSFLPPSHLKLQPLHVGGQSGNLLCTCLFLGHVPALLSVHLSPFTWQYSTHGLLESSVQHHLPPEQMLFPTTHNTWAYCSLILSSLWSWVAPKIGCDFLISGPWFYFHVSGS